MGTPKHGSSESACESALITVYILPFVLGAMFPLVFYFPLENQSTEQAAEHAAQATVDTIFGDAEPPPPVNHYPLIVLAVHDADTFTVNVDLGYDVQLANQQLRISNFDAWEVTRQRRTVGTITDAELAKGKVATAAAKNNITTATSIYLVPERQPRDVYGRLLGRVILVSSDGIREDYGVVMTRLGHARQTVTTP